VPPLHVRAHLIARKRESDFRLPSGLETLQVNADRVRRLYDWGKPLVDIAPRQPGIFNDRRKERVAAQVELLEDLLATLDVAVDFEPTRNDRTRQAQALIVRIAEDHALSRIDEHLHVTDLCKAADVSERTLEYAFTEIMGLTPVTYLIRLRLHRVRQVLLAATHGSTTVTAEALKWGFWHFGEFSRAHRECFGELPSDTLRRKPTEKQRYAKAIVPVRGRSSHRFSSRRQIGISATSALNDSNGARTVRRSTATIGGSTLHTGRSRVESCCTSLSSRLGAQVRKRQKIGIEPLRLPTPDSDGSVDQARYS